MTFVQRDDALSWGRVIRRPQRVASPRFKDELTRLLPAQAQETVLPIGLQRSYGDSVLNSEGSLISMAGLDRFIALDTRSGMLRAEAGVTLGEIMRRAVPRGFFLPVTPGTRFVTLGGAIANDVHGKNHHRAGTLGRHVTSFSLLRHDGKAILTPTENGNGLFEATIGGLGLTGLIEWAEIELQPVKSSFVDVDLIAYAGLNEFWDIAEASTATHEHTVAWIDCTARGRSAGRGIFSRGNWSAEGGLSVHSGRQRLGVPAAAPDGLLNWLTVKLFNEAYYAVQKRKAGALHQHYSQFFHPLDGLANWNRLYGGRGFWQYQCAVAPLEMKDAIAALLAEIASSGQGSFLAVLKTCGALRSPGMLSFPMEGATLALDFPNRGAQTLKLFTRLDAIVREAGGRLYAAKDGRIPKEMWAAGYPALGRFLTHADPKFASDFWRRVAP
ncbi:MAG: FAD-dependent oxidoreductase [Rhodomicrobium sp.]